MHHCTSRRAGDRRLGRRARPPRAARAAAGPSYQGACGGAVDHVVAVEGRHRHGRRPAPGSGGPRRNSASSLATRAELGVVPVDEVHLVDGQHDRRHAEQGGDGRAWRRVCSTTPWRASTSTTATSAADAPVTMLRGVLGVAGRVGDDERAAGRGEVAVGDVDRDALLALGPQAVGEQGEVELAVAVTPAGPLDGASSWSSNSVLVSWSSRPIRVRLAVVDRAGRWRCAGACGRCELDGGHQK